MLRVHIRLKEASKPFAKVTFVTFVEHFMNKYPSAGYVKSILADPLLEGYSVKYKQRIIKEIRTKRGANGS
jgi:hypothetical protein